MRWRFDVIRQVIVQNRVNILIILDLSCGRFKKSRRIVLYLIFLGYMLMRGVLGDYLVFIALMNFFSKSFLKIYNCSLKVG